MEVNDAIRRARLYGLIVGALIVFLLVLGAWIGGNTSAPEEGQRVSVEKVELVRRKTKRCRSHCRRRRSGRSAPRYARHHEDIFDDLAHCESGHRNVSGQKYDGYFQFLGSTWRSLGYSGRAYQYDYETQKEGARRLVARSGWGQFPVCSRRIGAR